MLAFALLQVTTDLASRSTSGPTWQWLCLAGLGLWQAKSQADRRRDEAKDDALRRDVDTLKVEMATINTHVGIDGNGITSQLKDMSAKIDRLYEMIVKRSTATPGLN